jgi:hypothetical protein
MISIVSDDHVVASPDVENVRLPKNQTPEGVKGVHVQAKAGRNQLPLCKAAFHVTKHYSTNVLNCQVV